MTTRISKIGFIAVLTAFLLPLGLPLLAPAASRTMISISRPVVHLRAGAGTGYDALWKLSRGYPLQVLARQGGWVKVRDFENDVGWVLGRLTGQTPHHVVKVPVANVRRAPGTGSRIVGRAQYGEVLRTLERRDQWVRVRQDGGTTGWVARRLLWGW
jgi:uncharacterized protein YgiM (DUF1202 family)